MTTLRSTIYIGDNTHICEVIGLEDHLGVTQTDATVTVTSIVDSDDEAVAGVSVPITLTHVSSGTYRGTLPHGASFVERRRYYATFKAIGAQGYRAEWTETLIARTRVA